MADSSIYDFLEQNYSQTHYLYDQGMQMNICSYALPGGWKLNQDVATNPYDVGNPFLKYFVEFIGTDGTWIRNLRPAVFSPMWGQRFEPVWQHSLYYTMGNAFSQINLMPIAGSQDALRLFRAHELPIQCYGYQRRLQGQIKGYQVEGISYILVMGNSWASSLVGAILLCPAGQLAQSLSSYYQIEASRVQNPQREQLYRQISSQAHNQLMATRRDAHQQRMKNQYQMMEAHNRRWSEQFRSNNWQTSQSNAAQQAEENYSHNDKFLDYIRDSSTFYDESKGHNVQVNGVNDYWFTNGSGEYIGTNDPNFNATAEIGMNWKAVKPLGSY